MKQIVVDEKDIAALLDKLELTKFRLKDNYQAEHASLAYEMHRKFHYEVVKFLQDQGADCKRS